MHFHILNKKECFLDHKNGVFRKIQKIDWKCTKNCYFPKGLVHGFFQKIELFIIFVFWANQPRKNRFFTFWIKK